MRDKLYYLKYNVESGAFQFELKYATSTKTNRLTEDMFYGIRKVLITEEQGNQFYDKINLLYLSKGKEINLNILEYEFSRQFYICKTCGKPTHMNDHAKRYTHYCYECYVLRMTEMYKESRAIVEERERVIKMQEYVKTIQGRCDCLGLKIIRSNIIIQLKKNSKTQTELAVALGVTDTSCHRILYSNKSIKVEYLYKISEFLLIPIDLLLKSPRGLAPLKKKNNIPIIMYRKSMKSIK